MRKCLLSYGTKKAMEVHDICAGVITACTGNSNVLDLPHTVAAMTTANTALQTAMNNAVNGGRLLLSEVRDAKRVVADMLTDTALYANTLCRGDESKLLSTGLLLNKVPEKHTAPEQVVNLRALFTNVTGCINLKWDVSGFAKYYTILMSADNGVTWNPVATTTITKLRCESLVSRTRYMFKIVAFNQYGSSPDSEPALQLAA